MNKYRQNIVSVFLLIISLLIITHSIIPHDHHYDIASDTYHHHDDKTDGTPFHCHFFNDIDFSEVRINGFTNIIKKTPDVYIVVPSGLFKVNLPFQFQSFVNLSTRFLEYCVLFSSAPTRGSPLV